MITRCTSADSAAVSAFVARDRGRCLYLCLDLEEFGFDSPDVSVWKDVGADGGFSAIALAYGTTYHLFSPGGAFDAAGWSSFLRGRGAKLACAEASLVRRLAPSAGGSADFGFVGRLEHDPEPGGSGLARPAAEGDFIRIARLLRAEAGYDRKYGERALEERLRSRWARGFSRNYVVEADGEIVSHMCTQAENAEVAIVGGFVTASGYRRRGYSRELFRALAGGLRSEGKAVYSFFYGDEAKRFNESIGMTPYCEWARLFM